MSLSVARGWIYDKQWNTKIKVNSLVLTYSMKIYFLNCKYAVANIHLIFILLFLIFSFSMGIDYFFNIRASFLFVSFCAYIPSFP
jgi:hypothetical protein